MKAWQRFKKSYFLYSFLRDPVAAISFAIFFLLVLVSIFAPLLAPHNPYDTRTIDVMDAEMPPSWIEGGEKRFGWAPTSKAAIFTPPCSTGCALRWPSASAQCCSKASWASWWA
jgi:ABC-type dipeptide/oligopeptide/nickel transport system permease subunit